MLYEGQASGIAVLAAVALNGAPRRGPLADEDGHTRVSFGPVLFETVLVVLLPTLTDQLIHGEFVCAKTRHRSCPLLHVILRSVLVVLALSRRGRVLNHGTPHVRRSPTYDSVRMRAR